MTATNGPSVVSVSPPSHPHRRRGLGLGELQARGHAGRLVDRLVVAVDGLLLVLRDALPGLGPRRRGGALVDHQQVLHRSSFGVGSPMRRTAAGEMDTPRRISSRSGPESPPALLSQVMAGAGYVERSRRTPCEISPRVHRAEPAPARAPGRAPVRGRDRDRAVGARPRRGARSPRLRRPRVAGARDRVRGTRLRLLRGHVQARVLPRDELAARLADRGLGTGDGFAGSGERDRRVRARRLDPARGRDGAAPDRAALRRLLFDQERGQLRCRRRLGTAMALGLGPHSRRGSPWCRRSPRPSSRSSWSSGGSIRPARSGRVGPQAMVGRDAGGARRRHRGGHVDPARPRPGRDRRSIGYWAFDNAVLWATFHAFGYRRR